MSLTLHDPPSIVTDVYPLYASLNVMLEDITPYKVRQTKPCVVGAVEMGQLEGEGERERPRY